MAANSVLNSPTTTKELAAKVEQFRFVMLDSSGKIKHADGSALPYGYVRQAAAPESEEDSRPSNHVEHALPSRVAVTTYQAVVSVAIDPTEKNFSKGNVFKPGDKVYVGADGTAATSAKAKGKKKPVGIAERADHVGRVRVNMFHPSVLVADSLEL